MPKSAPAAILRARQCFSPTSAVKAELGKLHSVPCGQPHTEESDAYLLPSARGCAQRKAIN